MSESKNQTIHKLIQKRWSPYSFSEKLVSKEILFSLFEAARRAPSSFNEQPWRYIVATKDNTVEFQKMLSCLVESNQLWAKNAPVLALTIAKLNFTKNDKPNLAAFHDIGLASANLTFEATSRGLFVHQMIGILPERIQNIYNIPEGFKPLTGLAIGYLGDSTNLPESLQNRDQTRRPRMELHEFVFCQTFGKSL